MGMRRAAAAVAVACWGGALALAILTFFGIADGHPWARLFSLAGWAAVTSSVVWALDKYIVKPVWTYQLGLEHGERRERRKHEAEPVSLLAAARRSGRG
ncbi:MAG TPA: hypothetical protein VH641_14420 [Streptosporangiaceae bacterium]|jgi:hypothetical protein